MMSRSRRINNKRTAREYRSKGKLYGGLELRGGLDHPWSLKEGNEGRVIFLECGYFYIYDEGPSQSLSHSIETGSERLLTPRSTACQRCETHQTVVNKVSFYHKFWRWQPDFHRSRKGLGIPNRLRVSKVSFSMLLSLSAKRLASSFNCVMMINNQA
jgi:hypothetical protein